VKLTDETLMAACLGYAQDYTADWPGRYSVRVTSRTELEDGRTEVILDTRKPFTGAGSLTAIGVDLTLVFGATP
jgi:hypothetical protein